MHRHNIDGRGIEYLSFGINPGERFHARGNIKASGLFTHRT
jgi:hypothetical protein